MFRPEHRYFYKSYLQFNRKQWISLNSSTIPDLTQDEVFQLKKVNKNISIKEIEEIYLPLTFLISHFINFNLRSKIAFKDILNNKYKLITPYIIGITGSVAAGKTTIAHILKILLTRKLNCYNIDLVTTDSFLYPNKILEKKNLMHRKGFPETYNIYNLIDIISKIKSKIKNISIPVYSHLRRNIISNRKQIIFQPDILILEGLNILQKKFKYYKNLKNYQKSILDFIDFSIYIDASEKLLKSWYMTRSSILHQLLYNNNFLKNSLFFSKNKQHITFNKLWNEVNKLNLYQNILPTRKKANLILCKSKNHNVKEILLKKSLDLNKVSL